MKGWGGCRLTYLHRGGVRTERPDNTAGQARICVRDKTGNRKETTQNPALPDVTEPLFIFQEERKKNNINNIRCRVGKGEGGGKSRRDDWLET